jgi:hypothetical protein
MDALQIEKDGKLIATRYHPEDQRDVEYDATDRAASLLFEPCTIAEGVTLRDIFLLINRHLDVFEKLLGNWCREFTTEALEIRDFVDTEDDDPLEYLELYHFLELDDETLYGMDRPDFHGISRSNVACSLSFIPTYRIAHLPVKLGPVKMEDEGTYQTTYTLGKILYGILWELSFYGAPQDRDEKSVHLQEIVAKMR